MLKMAKLTLLIFVLGLGKGDLVFGATTEIRVGHFPNVTHAPALIAQAKGHFENQFGENAKISWKIFSAGPEAIEALFAGAIDILYVGPNPAVNGFVRSKGEALHIMAGVANGGSAFVVAQDSGIEKFEDIHGKRVATPQKGNTQDVALLHLMREKGLSTRAQGGDVEVFNISGGDQITAFVKKQVDAIWTVEPWVSRLVSEANGKILFGEDELWPDGKYATTVLVVRKKFSDEHSDLVKQWVKSHVEIIDWIHDHFTEAKRIFNEELAREAGKPLPSDYLEHSFGRIAFTTDPMKFQVLEASKRALDIGYLGRGKVDLTNLFDLSFLDSVKEKKS